MFYYFSCDFTVFKATEKIKEYSRQIKRVPNPGNLSRDRINRTASILLIKST